MPVQNDLPPLDFLPLQDPATVRPFVEAVDGLLNLRFDMATLQSSMRISDPFALELEYTRTMMRSLLFCANPESILMIGMGGGSHAKYCHQTLPKADITVVEVNPHVIALRERFLVPAESSRFRVIQQDGARYVLKMACADSPKVRHDFILVDAFHFDGAPSGFASRAFFTACRSLLSPLGVLVMNLESEPAHSQPAMAQLSAAFDGGVWSVLTDTSGNRIAFASAPEHLMATMRQADARLAALAPVHRETLTRRVSNRLNFEPLFS